MTTTAKAITVNLGTAVLAVVEFQIPTLTSWPTIKTVAATPDLVELYWTPVGGARTTWTYGLSGTHVVKVAGGVYAATIPTKTLDVDRVLGLWVGTGSCTARAGFTITLAVNVAA